VKDIYSVVMLLGGKYALTPYVKDIYPLLMLSKGKDISTSPFKQHQKFRSYKYH